MTKPQRVLITFDTHTPYLAFRVRELQREITRRGWQEMITLEVVLIALEESSYQWEAGELSKLYGGVPVRALTDKFRGLGFRTWFRWTTIKTTAAMAWHYLKHRPHITFVGGYDRPESMKLAVLSIFTRGRVGVLHDSRFNDAESYSKSIWLEFVKSFMMRRYDFFMCPGRECAEYSRFLGGAKKPAYLGGWDVVDNEEISRLADVTSADHGILKHLGVADGTPYFFMPIRFLPKKNALMVISAFALASLRMAAEGKPTVRLVICGQGPMEKEMLEKIAALSMTENILLRPWLPYAQVPRANRLSLSLILASTHDQWGRRHARPARLAFVPLLTMPHPLRRANADQRRLPGSPCRAWSPTPRGRRESAAGAPARAPTAIVRPWRQSRSRYSRAARTRRSYLEAPPVPSAT